MTEPEVDEARFAAAQHMLKVTALRGEPLDDDSCDTCLYFVEPGSRIGFCWHDKLQALVGNTWWCHFWEMRDD